MKARVVLARLVLMLVVGTIVLIAAELAHVQGFPGQQLDRIERLGWLAPGLIVLLYVVGSLALLPGTPTALAAGFLFGATGGAIVASAGSTLGAGITFLAGRTFARRWVQRKIATNSRLKSVDEAVANQGFQVVLLARWSPVFPFGLVNYAFGVTRVSLSRFLLATWLGLLPVVAAYAYLGAAARTVADGTVISGNASALKNIGLSVGLVATGLLLLVLTAIVRRALDSARGVRRSQNDAPPDHGP